MRYCFFVFAFFLFFTQFVCAQRLIITDERTTWSVALAEFNVLTPGGGRGGNISYLGNILPIFFASHFSGIMQHTLSPEEVLLRREKIISDMILEQERILSSHIREYDAAYFGDTARRREIRNRIRESRRTIRQLRDYNLRRISIMPVKDIEFTVTDETNPLSFDVVNINRFAEERGFDYVFHGSVRQVSNIVLLEVRLFSSIENREIYSATASSEIENLFSSLDSVISEMTSILLGTTWSRITVTTDNRASDIFLNEEYIGTGSVSDIIVAPGDHILVIKGAGLQEKAVPIYLEEKQTTVFDFSIPLREEKFTAINTLPAGANVYFDSLWVGVTPLLLNGLSGEIIIRKDGFRDIRLLLDDVPHNSIELSLSPDAFRREDFIKQKRNTFYTNFSFFVLSAPITFFLYAAAIEYNSAANAAIFSNNNPAEIQRLIRTRSYTYYGYQTSMFLTMALLVNTIFAISDYIRAGDVLYNRNNRSFN